MGCAWVHDMMSLSDENTAICPTPPTTTIDSRDIERSCCHTCVSTCHLVVPHSFFVRQQLHFPVEKIRSISVLDGHIARLSKGRVCDLDFLFRPLPKMIPSMCTSTKSTHYTALPAVK